MARGGAMGQRRGGGGARRPPGRGGNANNLGQGQAPQAAAVRAVVTQVSPFAIHVQFSGPVIIKGIIDLHIRNPLVSPNELRAVSFNVLPGNLYQGNYQNNLGTPGVSGTTYKLYSFPQNFSTPSGGGCVSVSGTL